MKIWKATLTPERQDGEFVRTQIEVPVGAQILSTAVQGNDICVWFSCHPNGRTEQLEFAIVPTGGQIDDHLISRHIGTVLMGGGALVWHVFLLRRNTL